MGLKGCRAAITADTSSTKFIGEITPLTAGHEISGVSPANVHKLPCYRFYACFTVFFKTLYGIYTYHMYMCVCIKEAILKHLLNWLRFRKSTWSHNQITAWPGVCFLEGILQCIANMLTTLCRGFSLRKRSQICASFTYNGVHSSTLIVRYWQRPNVQEEVGGWINSEEEWRVTEMMKHTILTDMERCTEKYPKEWE